MSLKPDRGFFARIAGSLSSRRRRSDFTCSDCERVDKCSLPPSESCVVRAAQIERGDWKLRRKARALARTIGPI